MNTAKSSANIKKLVELALLLALVILFQSIGAFIRIGPTSVSLVLVPIALGAMLLGPWAGLFLGLVFGVMTLIPGIMGTDPFTHTLWMDSPLFTALICLGKAGLCGLVSGLVYKLVSRKNEILAVFLAAAAAPIVNTGLFILGGLVMFYDSLSAMAGGATVIYFLVIVCAGLNFVAEFAINMILSPAINRIINALSKKIRF